MFLDGHMSSSGRNVKHLKETFVMFVAAAEAEGGVRKDKRREEEKRGELRRYTDNVFAVVDIDSGFRSWVHFALQRSWKRVENKKKETRKSLFESSSSLQVKWPLKPGVHSHPSVAALKHSRKNTTLFPFLPKKY